MRAECCEQGGRWLECIDGREWLFYANGDYPRVWFCPFCGKRLNGYDWNEVLNFLLRWPVGLTLCFDVDGVLCDDSDPSVPYKERKPYKHALEAVRALNAGGHTIRIQTARYMQQCCGSQVDAIQLGHTELVQWLRRHEFPFDSVYLGKVSADLYIDDRGCHVDSNMGIIGWASELPRRLQELTKLRKKRESDETRN